MQSIRQTILLLTICLCANGIWATPSFNVFDRVWNDLADGGKSIIDGLRKSAEDGAKTGEELLKSLKGAEDSFWADVTKLGHDLSDAITEAFKTGLFDLSEALKHNIPALRAKVAAERNKVRKEALSKGLAALEQLNTLTNELQSGFADLNQKLGEKVNSQIDEKLAELEKWNEEQLNRVENGTKAGIQKAIELVQELNLRFQQNMADLLEELEFKKSQVEQNLNDKIDEYTEHVKNLIDTMHRCGIIGSNRKCQNGIDESVENLSDAQNELQDWIEKGNALLKAGLDASEAFALMLKQLAEDKLKCEKDLDEIIENEDSTTADETTASAIQEE